MSHVTDIILITAIDDAVDNIFSVDALNEYLSKKYGGKLNKVSQYSGGNKSFQADVFMAAVNYLDIKGFINGYQNNHWELQSSAQLLIKDEQDDNFRIISS
jgi:hypothetical protein